MNTSTLKTWWQKLTAPVVALSDEEAVHQATLVASSLLFATFITLIPLLFRYLIRNMQMNPIRVLIDVLVIGVVFSGYLIARRGYFRFAAVLVMVVGSVLVYAFFIVFVWRINPVAAGHQWRKGALCRQVSKRWR